MDVFLTGAATNMGLKKVLPQSMFDRRPDFKKQEDAPPFLIAAAVLMGFIALLGVIPLFLPTAYGDLQLIFRNRGRKEKYKTVVQVVVLGDIGHSPRMQNHAVSLAKHGAAVDVVAYQESEPHPDLSSNPDIKITPIAPAPKFLQTRSKLLFPIFGVLRAFWLTLTLFRALSYHTKPAEWMIVQAPPSIPTLFVATVVCFLRRTKLIIDWHNFSHTILALKLGQSHSAVRYSRAYERFFSKYANANLTVSEAMARSLEKDYGIKGLTLYDRPPTHFQPVDAKKREEFLREFLSSAEFSAVKSGKTKILVSSTSWTPDEDFSLLLDALVSYSAAAKARNLPNILAVITGKGPQQEEYVAKIDQLKNKEGKLDKIAIKTVWFSPQSYATFLGCADLGVSLHTSSSGVDLPMKVVDMFGTGLPVVGWSKYDAWPELVKEGVNGRGFGSADELSDLLVKLFGGDGGELRRLREGAMKEGERRWDGEWTNVAGRLLRLTE